jgi:hypothetical protein
MPLRDGSGFQTMKTYRVQFDWGETDYFFQVPKGFHTDLASIPALFKPLFGTWGKHTAAAVVHDCFYNYNAGTKEMADDMFEALMVEDGVNPTEAAIMAAATRLGGNWAKQDRGINPDVCVISEEGYWVNDTD